MKNRIITFSNILLLALILNSCNSINVYKEILSGVSPKVNTNNTIENPAFEAQHGIYSSFPERIIFYPENDLTTENFPEWISKKLEVTIKQIRQLDHKEGKKSTYYQQTYKSFPVTNSQYILHESNGAITYANGLLFDDIQVDVSAKMSEVENNEIIQKTYPNTKIIEVQPPTILALPNAEGNKYYFSYKSLIISLEDQLTYQVYVDINSKEVVQVTPDIIAATPLNRSLGTGSTIEGKTVSFNTEYVNSTIIDYPKVAVDYLDQKGFRLFDTIRNLHTVSGKNLYFLNEFEIKNSKDSINAYVSNSNQIYFEHEVISANNVFNNNPGAVEAHWSARIIYDYYKRTFNRLGVDNNNGYLKVVANFNNNFQNACYSSSFKALFLGDGLNNNHPYTSLDMVAHEYTHAIICDYMFLAAYGESSSIGEGLADIFASAITFFEGNGTWSLFKRGNRKKLVRNIKSPKNSTKPNTYKGEYWQKYATDQEINLGVKASKGIHNNSTVLSHWFYLLCEGGKGINDNKDHYKVEKIGMIKATKIVYESLKSLIPTVNFKQYREISIHTAEAQYGRCSNEVIQVTNAWNAVGVGDPFCDCFEGSLVFHISRPGTETNKMKIYFKEGNTSVEMVDEKGKTAYLYSKYLDPYWHVKGQPDLPDGYGQGVPFNFSLKQMFQRKSAHLILQKSMFEDRKAYTEYRNKHKTGREKTIDGYLLQENNLEGIRFWATEDVCLSILDVIGAISTLSPSIHRNLRSQFFGFPMEIYYENSKIWIDSVKEHPVNDSMFSG